MIFNYTYQTKNLVNGKTYIGIHTTSNLDDGYLGSGVILKKAIAKHGKENFKLEILSFWDTREEAAEEEEFLVNESWVLSEDNYNLVGGGYNTKKFYGELLEEHKAKAAELWRIEAYKKRKEVNVYDLDGKFITAVNGVREAGRVFNLPYRSIQRVIRGERNHTGGYVFKY